MRNRIKYIFPSQKKINIIIDGITASRDRDKDGNVKRIENEMEKKEKYYYRG